MSLRLLVDYLAFYEGSIHSKIRQGIPFNPRMAGKCGLVTTPIEPIGMVYAAI